MFPRVAYFPDSFHEINGVAHTSRNFVAYAQRHGLPFLCVRAGKRVQAFEQTEERGTLELRRSRVSIARNRRMLMNTVKAFQEGKRPASADDAQLFAIPRGGHYNTMRTGDWLETHKDEVAKLREKKLVTA